MAKPIIERLFQISKKKYIMCKIITKIHNDLFSNIGDIGGPQGQVKFFIDISRYFLD